MRKILEQSRMGNKKVNSVKRCNRRGVTDMRGDQRWEKSTKNELFMKNPNGSPLFWKLLKKKNET